MCSLLANRHVRKDFKRGRVSFFSEKEGICTMAPTGPNVEKTFFLWNNPAVIEAEINKAAVLAEAISLLERPEDNISWSL